MKHYASMELIAIPDISVWRFYFKTNCAYLDDYTVWYTVLEYEIRKELRQYEKK